MCVSELMCVFKATCCSLLNFAVTANEVITARREIASGQTWPVEQYHSFYIELSV